METKQALKSEQSVKHIKLYEIELEYKQDRKYHFTLYNFPGKNNENYCVKIFCTKIIGDGGATIATKARQEYRRTERIRPNYPSIIQSTIAFLWLRRNKPDYKPHINVSMYIEGDDLICLTTNLETKETVKVAYNLNTFECREIVE